MSEARALTNFSGNAIATVLVGHWTDTLDRRQITQVLDGDKPFDERTMLDSDDAEDSGDRDEKTADERQAVRTSSVAR
jgi:aerobic C4-dicarboxylate transport protein